MGRSELGSMIAAGMLLFSHDSAAHAANRYAPSAEPSQDTAGITTEGKCAFHNPLQSPFITGSHVDLTVTIPEGAIDTTNGATIAYTDLSNGHRIIGGDSIPAGQSLPYSHTSHGYIAGSRPNGFIPGEQGSDISLVDGQKLEIDVYDGNLDSIDGATPKASVIYQAPPCDIGQS